MAGLFVSSIRGHLVARFGYGAIFIGARFDPSVEGNVRYQTDDIVHIPETEYQAHKREYDAAIANGSLRKREQAEFEAAVEVERKKAEAEAKARADAKAQAEAEESSK